jgi:hypothetical protein
VQCGSWQNQPARLLNSRVDGTPPTRVVTTSLPRNWGGQELLDDVIMTSDYSLLPDALAATCALLALFPSCLAALGHTAFNALELCRCWEWGHIACCKYSALHACRMHETAG